jgi:hypothetical protein
VTWGELLFCIVAGAMIPPPWRFRLSTLLILLVVGVGG